MMDNGKEQEKGGSHNGGFSSARNITSESVASEVRGEVLGEILGIVKDKNEEVMQMAGDEINAKLQEFRSIQTLRDEEDMGQKQISTSNIEDLTGKFNVYLSQSKEAKMRDGLVILGQA